MEKDRFSTVLGSPSPLSAIAGFLGLREPGGAGLWSSDSLPFISWESSAARSWGRLLDNFWKQELPKPDEPQSPDSHGCVAEYGAWRIVVLVMEMHCAVL